MNPLAPDLKHRKSMRALLTIITIGILAGGGSARAIDVDGVTLGLTSCGKALRLAYNRSREACANFRYPDNVALTEREGSAKSYCVAQVRVAEERAEARRHASTGGDCAPPSVGINPFLRAAYGWEAMSPEEPVVTSDASCPYTQVFSELVYHPEDVVSVEVGCTGERASFYGKGVEESYRQLRSRLVARYGKPQREWTTIRRLPVPGARESLQVNLLFSPKAGGHLLLVNLATSETRRHALQVDPTDGPGDDDEEGVAYAPDSTLLYFDDAFLRTERHNFEARRDYLAQPSASLKGTAALPYKNLTTNR